MNWLQSSGVVHRTRQGPRSIVVQRHQLPHFTDAEWGALQQRTNLARGLLFSRPGARLGLMARAERHLAAGVDGIGWLEVLGDGAALCASGAGETEFRRPAHRAATLAGHSSTPRERSKNCYVFATFGALSLFDVR